MERYAVEQDKGLRINVKQVFAPLEHVGEHRPIIAQADYDWPLVQKQLVQEIEIAPNTKPAWHDRNVVTDHSSGRRSKWLLQIWPEIRLL
jgi:hypothetical protein